MENIVPTEALETHTFAAQLSMPFSLHDSHSGSQAGEAGNLVPYAAYDIGSGATKFMGAVINIETLSIETIFSQGSFPVGYSQDLYQSETNEFSDVIQALGLKALESAKYQIHQDYLAAGFEGYGDIQHFAVATAAFREAANGEIVAAYFEDKLDLPVNIISQEEEGILAYYSALSKISQDISQSPVVWDIGGGSMQLTFKDQADHFHIMGGEVASQTFQSLVSQTLLHQDPTTSPHPMTEANVTAAIQLAKEHLLFDVTTTEIIKYQIANQSPVIAVGSVHNFAIQPLCHLAGTHHDDHFYTKEDVQLAINLLTNKTDEQISHLIPTVNPAFVKNQLTNLILVYAMMDLMNIDKVSTVKSGNVEGLLLKNASSNSQQALASPIHEAEPLSLLF